MAGVRIEVVASQIRQFGEPNPPDFPGGGFGSKGVIQVTPDLDAQAMSTWLFYWGGLNGNLIAGDPSITGKGVAWSRVASVNFDLGGGFPGRYRTGIHIARGALEAGPVALDWSGTAGGGNADLMASVWWVLARARNAERATVVQATTFGLSAGGVVTAQLLNPVGDRRNAVVIGWGLNARHNSKAYWPFRDQVDLDDPSWGSAAFAWDGAQRSFTIDTASGGGISSASGIAVELGYSRVPWLRQRQRDDL